MAWPQMPTAEARRQPAYCVPMWKQSVPHEMPKPPCRQLRSDWWEASTNVKAIAHTWATIARLSRSERLALFGSNATLHSTANVIVRVYLVGYIFYIIDCHICRDIFGMIDIMYYRLSYISRSVLSLKTLVLYIYQPRGTIQYNQQLYTIYSSYMVSN
jgi:hypothetical protein